MSDDALNVDDLVIAYLEHGTTDDAALAALDPEGRAAFADVVADLDALRRELDAPATWEQPAPDLEERVLSDILAEPAPRAVAEGPSSDQQVVADAATTPAAAPAAAPVVSLAEARARRSRAVAVGASIVAAAAVLVAIVGFATRPSNPSGSESAGGPTTTSRVTIGPTVEAALQPTDLLPGATGTVRLDDTDSGVWIRLDATGLPRRDDGAFYQAWVRTPQGLVPIGTFHTGDDVVLWSGIPIADTDAVTVTLEENDGNQESSGQRVLVATIPQPGGTVPPTPATGPTGSAPR